MSDVASWVALGTTCLAAIITASNLGARVTGYGFAIFFVGAVAWCVVGATAGQHQLLWSNAFLALVDLFGVWRWLYRRARADDAVKRSKSEAEAPGDRLFAAVDLVGKRLAGEGGRTTLGRIEGLLADSDDGRLCYLTAESLTGGRLAAALTAVPGASATYVGGVVSYATSVKQRVLGVPAAVVDGPGVISPECALAMARGVVALTGATYGVSTTGVAGPDRQEGHPPGTVHVGLVGPGGATALALELVGDRATITDRTVSEALAALTAVISDREEPGLG